MKGVRPDIALLRQNGITAVAFTRIDDPKVIPLWFGEGDVVTADFIREAAKKALDDGETFYVHTRGIESLRLAIKSYLDSLYAMEVDPRRISVPGSAMIGVTIAAQMALNKGDEALIVSPHWPNIEATYRVTGAKINMVRQRETENGWQLTAAEIVDKVTAKTRSIYVNSPCNPTGWIMPRQDQEELLACCRERSILLIADEVYHRHMFGANIAPSFLEIAKDDDPVVVVNGFSKAWAMTGWRVGWVVTPVEQSDHWAMMSECFNTGATVFAQRACISALEQGEPIVQQLKSQYEEGARLVNDAFRGQRRIKLAPPKGAFYAFPKIEGIRSSLEFTKTLLAEEDVGVAPGYTFGIGNEQNIRLCFAQSHEKLQEGLERFVRFVERYDNH
ncbi:MAG: aminotransferase class I/II-fold pyridoxal phosphate-dependent enzyme [Gammaproteobacteria bacterium]|nr:aminotransferase class I/II-fold pyridoxal phosphate-dependent enzyme [Gammaproteobacteria bacterium]